MKFLGEAITEDLLILTKTYPAPSRLHREISCVAAINEEGELRRLYPIPYRFLQKGKQFKRWSWVRAKIDRASDTRPESFRVDIESLSIGKVVTTKDNWASRKRIIDQHLYQSFDDLERARSEGKCTLGFIRPLKVNFSMKPDKEPGWTQKQLDYLLKDGLFDSEDARNKHQLKKLPFQFRYSFIDNSDNNPIERSFVITDWEIGVLFWKCKALYGNDWEKFFRQKMETEIPSKDLILMFGTMRQYPDQWLIIGLIYPPKPKPGSPSQPYLI
jgi:hypothetical protein